MSEDNFPDPYKDCRPLEPDNDKTTIANLRAANDEMFTRLEDKDVALAAANREIHRLREEIMQIITK